MKKEKIRKKTIMKINLKKTIPILTITILLISTMAFMGIPVLANPDPEHTATMSPTVTTVPEVKYVFNVTCTATDFINKTNIIYPADFTYVDHDVLIGWTATHETTTYSINFTADAGSELVTGTWKLFNVTVKWPGVPPTTATFGVDCYLEAVASLNNTKELGVSFNPQFEAEITPTYVKGGASKVFTITTTNVGAVDGIIEMNVTHPSGWSRVAIISLEPETWTVSYSAPNFTLSGPNVFVDGSVILKVNMAVEDIGDNVALHNWTVACWDANGVHLANMTLGVDVDQKAPTITSIDHPSGDELTYYYTVGAGNRIWINITLTEEPLADKWPEDPVTNMTGDFTVVKTPHDSGTKAYKYYLANTTVVPDGTYVFHFNLTDSLGNVRTLLENKTVKIDNRSPYIKVGVYDTAGNLLPHPSPPYGAFYMNATIDSIKIWVNITEANGDSVNTTASWICINSTNAFTLDMTPTFTINSNNYSLTLPVPTSVTYQLINVSITDTATPVTHTESVTVEVKRDLVPPENLTYTKVVPINGGLIIYGLSADDLVGVYGYEICNATTITTVMEEDLTNTTWTQTTDYGAFSPGITVLNLTDYIGFVNITVKAKDYGFNPSDEIVLYTGVIDDGEWYPIVLYKDWNLVSLPLIPNSTASADVLSLVLNQGATGVSHVYEYDQTTDSWIIDPAKIEDGKGYWFYMKNYDVLIVSGSKMPPGGGMPPTYTLTKGWVLAGFKSTADMTVADYLASVRNASYFKIIYIWDAADQSWGILNRDAPTDHFTPGQGFWILMYEEEVLVPPTA